MKKQYLLQSLALTITSSRIGHHTMKNAFVICLTLLLGACAHVYAPTDYKFDEKARPDMASKGALRISSWQSSTDEVEVAGVGIHRWTTTLKVLTDSMVRQAQEQLQYSAKQGAGSEKTVELKIMQLTSSSRGFYFKSSMITQVRLGNGAIIDVRSEHASGWSVMQDLDGCIADGIIDVFKNSEIRRYLET